MKFKNKIILISKFDYKVSIGSNNNEYLFSYFHKIIQMILECINDFWNILNFTHEFSMNLNNSAILINFYKIQLL